MTFKKAFNDIFSEPLNEHGFQYNKKYGMYFRFVNDELLQYIMHDTCSSVRTGYKSYRILSGILSIYAYSLDKDKLLSCGMDTYKIAWNYYGEKPVINTCYFYNEDTMVEAINQSLEQTIEVLIPILNKVYDLNSYIEYRKKIFIGEIRYPAEFERYKNDSLVLIKTDNHDNFEDVFHEQLNNKYADTHEENYELVYDMVIRAIPQSRDKIYESPELYAKVMDEIEKRKEANLKTIGEIDMGV